MGSAVVDDIIIYVVTENAVRVQISFFARPSTAYRWPLPTHRCLSVVVARWARVVDRWLGAAGIPAVSRSSRDDNPHRPRPLSHRRRDIADRQRPQLLSTCVRPGA